jgi:hypothetical protein
MFKPLTARAKEAPDSPRLSREDIEFSAYKSALAMLQTALTHHGIKAHTSPKGDWVDYEDSAGVVATWGAYAGFLIHRHKIKMRARSLVCAHSLLMDQYF